MSVPVPTVPSRPRLTIAVAVLFSFVCGAGVASQSRVNGELGRQMHDGFAAAIISFASGLVIVLIITAFSRKARSGVGLVITAVRSRSVPFWYVLGGSAGAFLVLSQGLVAGILGVALFTIGIVAGQTLSGLLIDRRGLGTMAAKPLTVQRVIGAVLALVAVGIAVSQQISATVPIWMLILPFIAGLGSGWQQAVNGQVRAIADSPLTATLINFIVGTSVLLVAFIIDSLATGWPHYLPSAPWLYVGGALGVFFIGAAAILVRIIGVLLLGLGTVAGQLVTSLVIDVLAPTPGHATAVTTIVGTLLALVAVVIAAIPRRAKSPR